MLKIRRPLGRLIFNMGIAIPGKTVFLIETAPLVVFSLEYTPQVLYFEWKGGTLPFLHYFYQFTQNVRLYWNAQLNRKRYYFQSTYLGDVLNSALFPMTLLWRHNYNTISVARNVHREKKTPSNVNPRHSNAKLQWSEGMVQFVTYVINWLSLFGNFKSSLVIFFL